MCTLAMFFGIGQRWTATQMIWRKPYTMPRTPTLIIVEAPPGKILENQLTYPQEYPNEY